MYHGFFVARQRAVLRSTSGLTNESSGRCAVERLESRTLMSAGDFDSSYGMGGNLTIDFNAVGMDDGAEGVAKLKDGKFVIAGTTRLPVAGSSTPVDQTFLAAFNANGSIDTPFGQDGRVLIPGSPSSGGQLHVAAAPGGKVLLLEQLQGSQLLRRFTRKGTLDTTFGNAGTVDLSADDSFMGLAAGPAGKIVLLAQDSAHATPHAGPQVGPLSTGRLAVDDDVIAKTVLPTDFLVTRLTSAGAVDTTFGTGGSVETDFGFTDNPTAIAVQPNGKILAAGWWSTGLNPVGNTAAVRYNLNGTLDKSFGVGGKISAGNVMVQQMALTSQGGFQIASNNNQPITDPILTARYTSRGRLDTSYGTGGQTSLGSAFETGPLIDLSPKGKVVMVATITPEVVPLDSGGLSPTSWSEKVLVQVEDIVRLGAAGRFDKTFGNAGISNIPLTEDGAPEGIVVSNQRIFVILNVNDTINGQTDSNIRIVALKA